MRASKSPVLASRSVYERPGYRTLLGRIRANVGTYIRTQLELPRQEIAEIVQANLRAAKWLGIAAGLGLLALFSLVLLFIAVIAIWLPLPLAALIVTLLLAGGAGFTGYRGVKAIEIRGPQRTITSMKETVRWAKARLLGRNAS